MAESLSRELPKDIKRITTGCQYCAVGCGYNAFLLHEDANTTEVKLVDGVSRTITPAMTNVVRYKGEVHKIAVAPDARCDLNKGNHSVRGGSQGENLVTADQMGRSTQDRLTSPCIRLADGTLAEISWSDLNRIMAELIAVSTQMDLDDTGKKIVVHNPGGLGAKLFEYQYLENTFAATKLFYSAIGTPNVAFHDRPSAAGSSPALRDVGLRPHDFSYDDLLHSDVIFFIGTNPYENQSVAFMQYCAGKEIIVLDPRKTATAQYAESTGGIHLMPKTAGADSRLIYALARRILEQPADSAIQQWLESKKAAATDDDHYGSRWRLPDEKDLGETIWKWDDANPPKKHRPFQKRRLSRVGDLEQFKAFLGIDDDSDICCDEDAKEIYNLSNVANDVGIKPSELEKVISRIAAEREFPNPDNPDQMETRLPRVAVIYEKGIIWGFNYHNIAAIGSLSVLLGAYSEKGKLVGRVGGHQKGWASSRADLSEVFVSSNWIHPCNTEEENSIAKADYSEGYPFRNVVDEYSDDCLEKAFKPFEPDLETTECELENLEKSDRIQIQHNIDNHVFGPPPNLNPKPHPDNPDLVILDNGVTTVADPDVNLLWIVGGNYLGQTNDATRKRNVLEQRLGIGGPPNQILRPNSTDVCHVIETLQRRILGNGLVVVHQEMYLNPTSEYADIIIPAAGWGEDDFIRYNAQRRLKLFARFQDPPLHSDDREQLNGRDPALQWQQKASGNSVYQYSPKPDWRIFRDIGVMIGTVMDEVRNDGRKTFESKLSRNDPIAKRFTVPSDQVVANNPNKDEIKAGYFYWDSAAEVADDMAFWSQRGLASADSIGTSMLGDLLLYALNVAEQPGSGLEVREIRNTGYLHQLLGLDSEGNPESDALAPHLIHNNQSTNGLFGYLIPGESLTYGNGIASNGVMLPVHGASQADGSDLVQLPIKNEDTKLLSRQRMNQRRQAIKSLVGTLRVDRAKLDWERRKNKPSDRKAGTPFYFVFACWSEIDAIYRRINERADHPNSLLITNGRFNHLWNNMFHHIRNEYVNERWPENLPGTILEVSPEWANSGDREGGRLENGQVVHVTNADGRFTAIISKQKSLSNPDSDSEPGTTAFAMFSYPVHKDGENVFDGYPNNNTDGYCDGIHPIAALKYCNAVVTKAVNPFDGSNRWVYPEHFIPAIRLGPTFEERNQIAVGQNINSVDDRTKWEMRESIVRKGLPRAYVDDDHIADNGQSIMLDPDTLISIMLASPQLSGNIERKTRQRTSGPSRMSWRFNNGVDNAVLDEWRAVDHQIVKNFLPLVGSGGGGGGGNGITTDPEQAKQNMLELIRNKRDNNSAAIRHDGVTLVGGQTLDQLFADEDALLTYLATADVVNDSNKIPGINSTKLIVPGDLDRSLFYQMVVHSDGIMNGRFSQDEANIIKSWIETGATHNGGIDPQQAKQDMLELIRNKRDNNNAAVRHDDVAIAGGQTLEQLFADEGALLTYLATADVVNDSNKIPGINSTKLIVPDDLENSLFYQMIVHNDGIMNGRFDPHEIQIIERWIQSGAVHDP